MNLKQCIDTAILYGIGGSHAYGLATENSDTDYRGVFVSPKKDYYSLTYQQQISDDKSDIVLYELKRFFELLLTNNPNILELLNLPKDCIQVKHPILDTLKPEIFLSKLCKDSFCGYAKTQIEKARGLNKKILNPVELERKTPINFCTVLYNNGSIPLIKYLEKYGLEQKFCGLSAISNAKGVYALYYDGTAHRCFSTKNSIEKCIRKNLKLKLGLGYSGIELEDSNDIRLSSIPKGEKLICYISYNKDGYILYCKQYREYWNWFENKNAHRYEKTIEHNKNYDSKNMMHTFRLINMSRDIATKGEVIVRQDSQQRKELMRIRNGEYNYDTLIKLADEKLNEISTLFEKSSLPDTPNTEEINNILIQIREQLYV